MTAINGVGLTCSVLSQPISDIVPVDRPQSAVLLPVDRPQSAVLLGLYCPRQETVLSRWWLGFPSVGIGNPGPRLLGTRLLSVSITSELRISLIHSVEYLPLISSVEWRPTSHAQGSRRVKGLLAVLVARREDAGTCPADSRGESIDAANTFFSLAVKFLSSNRKYD